MGALQSKIFIDNFKVLIKSKIEEIISYDSNLFNESQNNEFENNFELYQKICVKRKQIYEIIQKFDPNKKLIPFTIQNRKLLEEIEKKLDYYCKILSNLSEIYKYLKRNYKNIKYIINNAKDVILKNFGEEFFDLENNGKNLIEEKSEIILNDDSLNNSSVLSSQIYSIDFQINEIIENESFDNDFTDENLIKIKNNIILNQKQYQYFLSKKSLFYEKIIYIYDDKSHNNIYFFFYNKMLKFKIDKNNIISLDYSKYFDLIIYEPELILDISPLLLFFNIDYDNKKVYIIKFNLLSDEFFIISTENSYFFRTLISFKKKNE